jgi:hypothetical protein
MRKEKLGEVMEGKEREEEEEGNWEKRNGREIT